MFVRNADDTAPLRRSADIRLTAVEAQRRPCSKTLAPDLSSHQSPPTA